MSTETHTIPEWALNVARRAYADSPIKVIGAMEAGALVRQFAKAIHDAVMAERQWRPIGTAPKTGETIIVRLANGEVFSATWHVYGANPGWHVSSDIGFVNPHHWMPLPATQKARG